MAMEYQKTAEATSDLIGNKIKKKKKLKLKKFRKIYNNVIQR